jgi:hypothetical protein
LKQAFENNIIDPAANNKALMVHKLLNKIYLFCFALIAGSY